VRLPPNRSYTKAEADQIVVSAVELFLAWEHGTAAAPDTAPKGKRRAIWSAGDSGDPVKVHDEARYLAELRRLGLDTPNYVIDENSPEVAELPPEEAD
jgi:hypothetical protein